MYVCVCILHYSDEVETQWIKRYISLPLIQGFSCFCLLKLHFPILKNYRSQNKYVFTNPSTRAGSNTRSFLKRSLTSLNPDFPSPILVA